MENITPLLPFASQIVPEDPISLRRISDVLDAAFVDHQPDDDGDLYVTDGIEFPLWLRVDGDAKLITIFTCMEPEGEVPFDWLEEVNRLNRSIILPQFSHQDGALWGRYWVTYDGGLNVRHFIKLMRRFSGAFRVAVDELQLIPQGERAAGEGG